MTNEQRPRTREEYEEVQADAFLEPPVASQLFEDLLFGPRLRVQHDDDPPMPAADFIKASRPRGWLIEGVLPREAIGVVGGAPGSGKSWLAVEMGLAVASARPFLGNYHVSKAETVLLIDQDSPDAILSERLAAQSREGLTNFFVKSHAGYSLRGPALAALIKTVERVRPGLVIMETLDKFYGGRIEENSSSDINEVMNALKQIRKASPCTILLVHHLTKAAREGADAINRLRGSSALGGSLDFAYTLSQVPGAVQRYALQSVPKRFKTVPGVIFRIDTSTVGELLSSAELRFEKEWDGVTDLMHQQHLDLVHAAIFDVGTEGTHASSLSGL